MTVKLIANTFGEIAEAVNIPSGTLSTGFDTSTLICGARNELVALGASSSAKSIEYDSNGNDLDIDHCIITRLDLSYYSAINNRITGIQRSSSGGAAGSGSDMFDLNPLAESDLIGPYGQDYAVEITNCAGFDGYGVEFTPASGDREVIVGQIYFGQAFDFGVESVLANAPQFINLPDDYTYGQPVDADIPYAIESRFAFTWDDISISDIDAFQQVSSLLELPLFLYDAEADVIPWKLEHVILESFEFTHKNYNRWQVACIFGRLKHYGATL